MIASARPSSPSSIAPAMSFIAFLPPGTPGSIFSRSWIGPSLRISRIWVRKSSSVNWFFSICSAACCACSASIVSWALSIRVRTSPMPRIRPAIRSG